MFPHTILDHCFGTSSCSQTPSNHILIWTAACISKISVGWLLLTKSFSQTVCIFSHAHSNIPKVAVFLLCCLICKVHHEITINLLSWAHLRRVDDYQKFDVWSCLTIAGKGWCQVSHRVEILSIMTQNQSKRQHCMHETSLLRHMHW